jgi:hypothetical protein
MSKPPEITVHNNGLTPLQVGLEPEGDCVTVPVGGKCVVRGTTEGGNFEVEVQSGLLSVTLDSIKEVDINGVRVRWSTAKTSVLLRSFGCGSS